MLLAKNYNNLSIIIFSVLISLFSFYSILFFIFSQVLVDTIIGISLITLFYLFYFFFKKSIYNSFLIQWTNILFFFYNLLFLISSLKIFILNLNYNYLYFLKYKIICLYTSLYFLDFSEVKLNLINLININIVNYKLLSKLSIIDQFNKYLILTEFIFIDDNIILNNYHQNLFYEFIING